MALSFKSCMLSLILLIILKLQILVIRAEPQVPCYFVFGDSLVDVGNNNNLVTQAKVNYPPYGVDFRNQTPTGRFTNGENTADIIGRLLGFANYTPPFATARGPEILQGVNYGSGGSGIRDETGRNLGDRISMNEQLLNHGITKFRIALFQGNISFTKEYLRKCIYTVGMGNNDFINNYLMPDKYITSRIYTPEQYADVLIQQYSKQLKTLYNYEARKVAVFGLGQVGCTPAIVMKFGPDASGCVDRVNAAINLVNDRLKPLIDDLNSNLSGAKFIYINTTNINQGDPIAAGFRVFTPCCIASVDLGKGQCEPNLPPCTNRDIYIFWDEFHPTQRANNITATRSYMAASPLDSYPMDIRSLAQQ
ncbi:GDSL esterase/lipase At1g29670-like [Apium graveolens]|uniref:GDSL esterase/lipase At1g29670-like n=1 Tax=Apium graveolens TaxID=4045 RepID=UPI003D7BCC77